MIFLANRANLQLRRLHRERIVNRFESDSLFKNVEFSRAGVRAPGQYRVVAETDPRLFLDTSTYPVQTARIAVGFDRIGTTTHDHYWIYWVEPERSLLVGWHQDDTHPEFGDVHLQLNHEERTVEHATADFVDSHPMDVLSYRLSQLPDAVTAVQWTEGRPTGFDY